MKVIKRDGSKQKISFDKISQRIGFLIDGIEYEDRFGSKLGIDCIEIAREVCSQVVDGITTSKLDEYAAEVAADRVSEHPEYDILSARIIISNNHKNSKKYKNFSDMMNLINDTHGILSKPFLDAVENNKNMLDAYVNDSHNNDFKYLTYFGYKTLDRSYLIKSGRVCERPQHLLMRVALDLNRYDIQRAINCYEYLCGFYFIHATPTLFNSGSKFNQYSSCFLLGMADSIRSMYGVLHKCAHISKWSGGIGIWITKIRANGSLINSTRGKSSGPVPLLKVFNFFVKHVDQGGGKRNGSVAFYIEPWHADIQPFLQLKRIVGKEEARARNLFYAIWVPDIFMRRLQLAKDNEEEGNGKKIMWSLMCPYECPGLADTYGEEFDELYVRYEEEGKYREQIDILDLWEDILDSQIESGTPYLMFKDTVNRKSNQKNIGIIRSSNLCTEIVQYSNPDEFAVCNLSSICLHRFVIDENKINHDLLAKISGIICRNINNVINQNYYPGIETMQSNLKHRPMAIGVQGLAETFIKLRIPYQSDEAFKHNREIFESIYYGALRESCTIARERGEFLHDKINNLNKEDISNIKNASSELMKLHFDIREYIDECHDNAIQAVKESHQRHVERYNDMYNVIDKYLGPVQDDMLAKGLIHIYELQFLNLDPNSSHTGAYSSFEGSPFSEGILQFDMCDNVKLSGMWDWDSLKQDIIKYGTANSQLTSLMPTASTAQIMGCTEAFEPIKSNIYTRRVLAGEFMVVNRHLQNDLIKLGIWSTELKDKIIANNGSLIGIDEIPNDLKELYKTAYEMSIKKHIKMSAERGAFIDQSQSFNIFSEEADHETLTLAHLTSWHEGLKTGMYYLRTKPPADPQKFTVEVNMKTPEPPTPPKKVVIKNSNDDLDTLLESGEVEYGSCPIDCTSCQ